MALIPFQKPTLRRKDMDAVLQTMVDERIGPGVRKNTFLKQFCELIKTKGGVALRSYIDAIRISLLALKLPSGASIGMSILSPSCYLVVLKELGYQPMFGDIDSENGCLSEKEALRLVEQGCQALLVHEPMGQIPYGIEYTQCNVPVIEDISQSLESRYEERKAGSWGDLIICALEEDGVVSTAGGAVLSSAAERYAFAIEACIDEIQPYVELPDMNAALGSIQLANLEEQLTKRRELYSFFSKSLMKTQHRLYGINTLDFQPNGYGFCTVLDSKAEDAIKFAAKYQVSARKTFQDTVGSAYSDCFDLFPQALPALLRAISLPLYPFLKQSDVELLMKVISHLP